MIFWMVWRWFMRGREDAFDVELNGSEEDNAHGQGS